jgi:predicted RecB family nuclease
MTILPPSPLPVSLLNGLHREAQAHLRQKGITTLQQFVAMTPDELLQIRYIGKTTAPALHAQARAWVEQRAIWCATLPKECQQSAWCFDIETHPETGEIWSIGWSDLERETQVIVVNPHVETIVALTPIITLAPSPDAAWAYFASQMVANRQPIMHWTGFDASVMKKTAPRHVVLKLEKRLYDLHHTFKRIIQIPAQGTSLKTVAAYMGFAWSGYQDWFMAFQDYQRWLRTGDDQHIVAACAYQADDVKAMVVVLKWLNTLDT